MKTIPLSLALSVLVLSTVSSMAAERVYPPALFPIPYKLAVDHYSASGTVNYT